MLPEVLEPLASALRIGLLETSPTGYRAHGLEHAPIVDAPGLPPFDHYWSSFVETGIYVRLDLHAPLVPSTLAQTLADQEPAALGTDGAFYVYERSSRSQHANRAAALASLAARVARSLARNR